MEPPTLERRRLLSTDAYTPVNIVDEQRQEANARGQQNQSHIENHAHYNNQCQTEDKNELAKHLVTSALWLAITMVVVAGALIALLIVIYPWTM